jgi:hypothetical protein
VAGSQICYIRDLVRKEGKKPTDVGKKEECGDGIRYMVEEDKKEKRK